MGSCFSGYRKKTHVFEDASTEEQLSETRIKPDKNPAARLPWNPGG